MRHRYLCPIRWADLDLLGHVNNVRYVDYLQEARVDLMRAHRWAGDAAATDPGDGLVVVRHEVSYTAPLLFSRRPVVIECWVTELRAGRFTMAYEVLHEDEAGERTVYLRASTVLAPYRFDTESPRRLSREERSALEPYLEPQAPAEVAPVRVRRSDLGHYPVQVRFSDVDVYRHVNNVVYFEYFQEARLRLFMELARDVPGMKQVRVVVAQTDVDYREAITLRAEPYDCWTQVAAVGRRSMTVESEIVDGDRVFARARVVLVFFDTDAGQAVEPPAAYRERLVAAVSPACSS
ncbi:thioesterase family protein [Nocardioides panacisoli]|uniref:acyl-CoA thioesterase n=1 Tax=Nocardioides panacisoli TaxID=627624 RepID=UPI001C638409|nr:thioesterase family protein [Nocardioides panacisoli]QYJ04325.1 thioesterase family protein [Nocardioides panacisoli]